MNDSLEDRFMAFVEQLEAAENIDKMWIDSSLSSRKRADFLLNKRRIVLEIKSLTSDPEYKVEERLGPHRSRPEFPAFYWQSDLNEILPYLPDGREVQREIFHTVTRAVQGALERADDQIRETKAALGIPSACGVVALLNKRIGILGPDWITAKATQILLKTKDGSTRYRHIAYVWIISESHRLAGKSELEHLPMVLLVGPIASEHVLAGKYLDELQRQWAAFEGVPLFHLGERKSLDGLTFEKRTVEEPSTAEHSSISRQEIWRRTYQQAPYLRHLSEDDFLEHSARLIRKMMPHFLKGGRNLPNAVVAELMERWTHVLEEAEFRRLDMRKLQRRLPNWNTLAGEPDQS